MEINQRKFVGKTSFAWIYEEKIVQNWFILFLTNRSILLLRTNKFLWKFCTNFLTRFVRKWNLFLNLWLWNFPFRCLVYAIRNLLTKVSLQEETLFFYFISSEENFCSMFLLFKFDDMIMQRIRDLTVYNDNFKIDIDIASHPEYKNRFHLSKLHERASFANNKLVIKTITETWLLLVNDDVRWQKWDVIMCFVSVL